MLAFERLIYILMGYLLPRTVHFFKTRSSSQWPKETATVLTSNSTPGSAGAVSVIVYSYTHEGRYCSGTHEKPFLSQTSAKRYAANFPKGSQMIVRVKPEVPTASIVHDHDQTGWR